MFQDEFTQLFCNYPSALDNKRIFSGLVKDLFPCNSLQANLIIALYEMNIHSDMAMTSVINNAFAFRFVKRLMDERGISRVHADWAVSIWCVCYGESILHKPSEIKINDMSKTGQPAITEEKTTTTKYQDLFVYKKSSDYDGYSVIGFNGENQRTIIFQNRFRNNGVVEISDSAFSKDSIQEAIFSDGYLRIGNRSFQDCTELSQVILPMSLKEIGDYAFSGCGMLSSVTLPINLQSIGKYSFASTAIKNIVFPALFWIDVGAFSDCKKLNNIKIPDNITKIPEKCFFGCEALTKITLSNTVDYIGSEAFMNCSGLMQITIPDEVSQIGKNAFIGTHSKFILQCSPGSYTEAYAQNNKLKYQLI